MSERAPTNPIDGSALGYIEGRLRDVELQLAAVSGAKGIPGWIERIEKEHTRSASSQGQRLEKLKTSITSDLALLRSEISQLRDKLEHTRDSTNDTRARLGAGIAVLLALISLAGVLVKVLH